MSENPSGALRLLLLTLFYTPTVGGSINYIATLAAAAPADTLTVATPITDDPAAQRAFDASAPYRIIRWPPVYSPLFNSRWHKLVIIVRWTVHLLRLLRRQRFDALIVSGIYPLAMVAEICRLVFGVPFIILSYGEELSIQRYKEQQGRGWVRWVGYRMGMRRAAGHIVISDATAQTLRDFGIDAAQITRIRPPLAPPDTPPTADELASVRAQLGLEGKRIVLCAGRLIARKGQDHLIRAMPQVRATVPDAVLVIAGDGPYEDTLHALVAEQQVADPQMAGAIILAGRVEDRTLAALYALCDVFAMPNRTMPNGDVEGFGIVFIEASAYGKPVVGGNSGGTSDAIIDGTTGFLVDGYDIDAIAGRVVDLLQDDDLAGRMGVAGREWVHAELDPQQAAAQLFALVASISQRRA